MKSLGQSFLLCLEIYLCKQEEILSRQRGGGKVCWNILLWGSRSNKTAVKEINTQCWHKHSCLLQDNSDPEEYIYCFFPLERCHFDCIMFIYFYRYCSFWEKCCCISPPVCFTRGFLSILICIFCHLPGFIALGSLLKEIEIKREWEIDR